MAPWKTKNEDDELAELADRRADSAQVAQRRAAVQALVDGSATTIPEPELRREFLAMGEHLISNPIQSYR